MFKKTQCLGMFLGLFSLSVMSPAFSQSGTLKKHPDSESRATIQTTALGLISELSMKGLLKGVFINYEGTRDYDNQKLITITTDNDGDSDDSIEDMLDQIARQSHYTWEKHGKVINVFPRETMGDKDYVFNAVIDEIHIHGQGIQTVMGEIRNKLKEQYPGKFNIEYQGQERSVLSYTIVRSYPNNQQPGVNQTDTTSFSIDLRHATVREILNVVSIQETSWGVSYVNTPGFVHQALVFTSPEPYNLPVPTFSK